MPANRCRCGGGRAHHEHDVACWCPRCLPRPIEERCSEYSPLVPVTLPKPPISTPSQPTSSTSGTATQPTATEVVLHHVIEAGHHGATVGEIATYLRIKPGTIQRALKALEEAGNLVRSTEPRHIGGETEQLWLATDLPDDAEPQQATLWS